MPVYRPASERFWEKVDADGDCWEWVAGKNKHGYGTFNGGVDKGRSYLAHVFSYEELVGPVPLGLVIDHLCRNHACVNPDHLQSVTQTVNCQRGFTERMIAHRNKVCVRGHPYTEENTYIFFRPGKGYAACCRVCKRDRRMKLKQQGLKVAP